MSMCWGKNVFLMLCLFVIFFIQNYVYCDNQNNNSSNRYIINKVYKDENLKEIAFPLGGFGGGQIYIRGNGKLSPWEITNNFNSNANVSDAFFSIYTEDGEQSKAYILQLNPSLPGEGVNKIDFIGEFPFAKLIFGDFSPDLDLSMECFSPFIPLDEKNSSLPVVFFTFTLKNYGTKNIRGSLAGTIPNIVGWDGYRELLSSSYTKDGKQVHAIYHPELGYNINTIKKEIDTVSIDMGITSTGKEEFKENIQFFTNLYDCAQPLRFLRGININYQDNINPDNEEKQGDTCVYWLGPSEKVLSSDNIEKLNKKIQNGAHLIVSGDTNSIFDWLVAINRAKKSHKKEHVFDNFESGTYNLWTITGDAFGDKPANDKFPMQTDILGYEGKYFVNSYNGDDKKTGTAISKEFTIQHSFIHFRIGGGNKPDNTYIALIIEGEKILSSTGSNSETLKKVIWNVAEYIGKKAHIEIVDNASDGWGHILIDEIVFTNDYPIDKNSYKTLQKWLPMASIKGNWINSKYNVKLGGLFPNLKDAILVTNKIYKTTPNISTKQSEVFLKTDTGIPLIIRKKIGKGSVVWCNGKITDWIAPEYKRRWIASLIALTTNVPYIYEKGLDSQHPLWGNMVFSLKTFGKNEPQTCPQWSDFNYFWQYFSKNGILPQPESMEPSNPGYTWNGTIAYPFDLSPGEKEDITFILAWYFPNRTRGNQYYWTLPPLRYDYRLGNYYNNYFKNAMEVTNYCIDNFPYLLSQTSQFHKDFFSSTLPPVMLEAISANIATLHTPIYIYLEDGTVGGFEGTDNCCPMNCTHVYNYAQTLPFLFPILEQRIRYQELFYMMDKTEFYIPHRFIVPPSEPQLKNEIGGPFHHALDGELGTLLKLYREYKLSPDKKWLEPIWHNAIKVFQHILEKHDPTGEGIIRGEQPNTYDTHLYGSNTFIGTLYLATLKAMEIMLKELGSPDPNLILECQKRYESGRKKYIETCWNEEYFINAFDAPDVGSEVYNQMNCYGPGCHSDQLLGQWWSHILGLGYLFPEPYIKTTLNSIYKNNWRKNFYDHVQSPRRFAEDDEPGLLMCTWPKGGRPESPILYCDEIWTGMEYEVAGLSIFEGDWDKAVEIVSGARSRYQGNRKNPWSEIECGGHYARAMSAYSMLIAGSGFNFDKGKIKITPRVKENPSSFFFSTGTSWGIFEFNSGPRKTTVTIIPHYGKLEISRISLPAEKLRFNQMNMSIIKGDNSIPITEKIGIIQQDELYKTNLITVLLRQSITVLENEKVVIDIRW
ncbi:MAG: GH116 family glycosyl-hydrolase [Candidatus Hydrogenedens sp.]